MECSTIDLATDAQAFDALPVLNYGLLSDNFASFVNELRNACMHVGFFVLAGLPPHSVALHDRVLRVARAFFELPLEEKSLIDYRHSPHFRGYMWQGAENTAGRRDEREQVEFGREEPAAAIEHGTPLFERLRGPNQWPSQPEELQHVVCEWLQDMDGISRNLTRALAASLGLEADAFDRLFLIPHVQAKLVHYPAVPPIEGENTAIGNLGVGAHSDSGFLTLLLQDDVGGLEVLNSKGSWVPARPLPGTIICNLGEVVQLLTGGAYLSTVHRVRQPHRGRVSAPFFWNPSLDAMVEPLIQPGGEAAAHRANGGRPSPAENRLLPSYGMNAFKSLARSHPVVFARHHPDLQCLPDGQVVARKQG